MASFGKVFFSSPRLPLPCSSSLSAKRLEYSSPLRSVTNDRPELFDRHQLSELGEPRDHLLRTKRCDCICSIFCQLRRPVHEPSGEIISSCRTLVLDGAFRRTLGRENLERRKFLSACYIQLPTSVPPQLLEDVFDE